MNAPSPVCLRALSFLISPPLRQHECFAVAAAQRAYAAGSKARPSSVTKSKSPTPPPPPIPTRPRPTFRPSPSGPDLRKRRDDDEDFTPYPLPRPIGLPNPPRSGENTGQDKRSFRQRRDDFHDYNKHLEKRAKMTRQIAKPYFRDWSNMRFHKGKVFVANERLFRAEHALFFPNFLGKTLDRQAERRDKGNGYGGFGRNTCESMYGKVSVVSIVSNKWAEGQVATFCSEEVNKELWNVIKENNDIVQRIEINIETNFIKWWLLQWFASGLRKSRSKEEQQRYFMVKRGVSETIKEAIGLLNDKGGYVYLVDPDCKIRWAGSAEALDAERESMVKGLRKLAEEARTLREKLQPAVEGVVEEEPAKVSTANA